MDVTKGLVYYTNSQCKERMAIAVRDRLREVGLPIVSVSHKPLTDFGLNIVVDMVPGILTMFKQILIGLEISESDVIFLVEHDVLYDPFHFDFTPPKKDIFYYNVNTWTLNMKTGKGKFHNQEQTSGLCAYRELLVRHYRSRIDGMESGDPCRGFEPGISLGIDSYKAESWKTKHPNIDLRHDHNLTYGRFQELL